MQNKRLLEQAALPADLYNLLDSKGPNENANL